jgi:glycosyltransferase involved in cell wall biosynthesis
MDFPVFSVIIPVHLKTQNQKSWFRTCLRSVLNQTFRDFDVWIIDDQSPLGGCEKSIVKEIIDEERKSPVVPIHLIKTSKNFGAPAGPRNIGIRKSQGKWLAFLDHDDIWLPEKLALQWDEIQKKPNLTMIHTNARFITDTPSESPLELQSSWKVIGGKSTVDEILQAYTVMSTVCIRREFLEDVRYLDESTSPCDDTDLFVKLGEKSAEVSFIPKVCCDFRVDPETLSKKRNLCFEKGILVLDKAISRCKDEVLRKTLSQAKADVERHHAYGLFHEGDFQESFKVFQDLAHGNHLDWKGRIYRFALEKKHPEWIYGLRKIRNFSRSIRRVI